MFDDILGTEARNREPLFGSEADVRELLVADCSLLSALAAFTANGGRAAQWHCTLMANPRPAVGTGLAFCHTFAAMPKRAA